MRKVSKVPGHGEKFGRERDVWLSFITLFFFSFPSFPLGAPLISWVFVVARVVEELRRLEGTLGRSMQGPKLGFARRLAFFLGERYTPFRGCL